MKPVMLFFAAVMTAMPLAKAATYTPKPATTQRAEVVFVAPEKFTDVRDSYMSTDSGRDAILDQIRSYMLEEARRFIPEGDHLYISVTDVDLAGDFEPWRGPRWDDVRIVKDIYPPRMALSFRVTGPNGQVIKEGTRHLQDLAFMMKITPGFQDDPLRHDKAMIDDWFHEEFRDLKK